MGLRFRKSITIAKGVKLNISKSGASLSLGKKGATVNIGKNGVYGNLGLPGTGLSYRKKLLGKPTDLINMVTKKKISGFDVEMDAEGNIKVFKDGQEITDKKTLDAIKQTDEYKQDLKELKTRIKEEKKKQKEDAKQESAKKSEEVEEYEELEELLMNIHTLSCKVNKKGADGDLNEEMEAFIEQISLPVEINVGYEYDEDNNCLYVDLDLPEIEDLPEEEVVQNASGAVKTKKKTQVSIKEEYIRVVFGLAIFLSSYFFNMKTEMDKILMSAYTQRRNKDGDLHDDYIYSIKFDRTTFEKTKLTEVDPYAFCMGFENRCNITSSKIMKEITPFDKI